MERVIAKHPFLITANPQTCGMCYRPAFAASCRAESGWGLRLLLCQMWPRLMPKKTAWRRLQLEAVDFFASSKSVSPIFYPNASWHPKSKGP